MSYESSGRFEALLSAGAGACVVVGYYTANPYMFAVVFILIIVGIVNSLVARAKRKLSKKQGIVPFSKQRSSNSNDGFHWTRIDESDYGG
jgi:hypothetical protein